MVRVPVLAERLFSLTIAGMATTVLIVDDHATFRSLARRLLEHHGFEVVGEARDGEAGLDAVRELRPDVVLLDVQMPGIDGFEVAARLAAEGDPPAVVMVSSRDRDDFGGMVDESAVLGFIAKHDLSGPALAALLD
jgi:DNA-binding NarL/FixJ family response regulator